MSKTEILAELPNLRPEELDAVHAKLDELVGGAWLGDSGIDDADKSALDLSLAEYRKQPSSGSSWEEVRARKESKLHP